MEQFIEFVINHPILVGLFVVLLALLVITEIRKGGQAVTTGELTRLVNRDHALILDIRDKKDFVNGHIVDAINIPVARLTECWSELDKHKMRPIVIVDSAGQHAGIAGKQLMDAGFTDVRRLRGGLSTWQSENLPLVKTR